MLNVIKSEFLKGKHTSINKYVWATPLLIVLLSAVLGGGQNGAYNWWYVLFLPGMLAIISAQAVTREKKISYKGVFLYPVNKQAIWLGKILYISILLTISCTIFMISNYVIGFITSATITLKANITATVILIMTFLFQIPINLFMTARFNMFAAVLFNLIMSIISTVAYGSSSVIQYSPYGIGQYLMVPVLHIFPNGLPVPQGSYYLNGNMIIAKTLIGFAVFIILSTATMIWFTRKEIN